jgi:hypothetical protein
MTLVDQVVSHRKGFLGDIQSETCTVMTRRIRWLFITRSRTTVLPGPDCGDSTPGFIVWWNTDDPVALQSIHDGMVRTIERTGFMEPAVWCHRRHEIRDPRSLDFYWQDQLGDLFVYYRRAT